MSNHSDSTGYDETLANTMYTTTAPTTRPVMHLVRFEYVIHRRKGLLESVAEHFGASLRQPLSADHRALIAQEAEQTEDDMIVVRHMQDVQTCAVGLQ